MCFASALQKLSAEFSKEGVRWAVWAGFGASAYGSDRKPTDIDIGIMKEDVPKVNHALDHFGVKRLHWEHKNIFRLFRVGFNLEGEEIDICGDGKISVGGKQYKFVVDDEMFQNIQVKEIEGIKVPVISPEDIILLKAICQRGKEQGKFDVEDIKSILAHQKIDYAYLEKRAELCGAKERVMDLISVLKETKSA
ncbi:MAG: nucleotidyltransferase [archaeon]